MARMRRPAPSLEILEDRSVPATIRFDGSNLFISNARILAGKTTLTVTQLDSGAFQIKDSGINNGTYTVGGTIYITGTTASDSVTLTLNKGLGGTNSLPGSLNINENQNGNNTVTVTTNGTGGRIGGNMLVNFGRGADLLNAEPAGAGTPQLTIGGSVQITGQAGAAQLNPAIFPFVPAHNFVNFAANTSAGQTTFIGGNVTIQGIDDIKLGIIDTNGGQTIGGNVSIYFSANAPTFVDQFASGTNTPYNNYLTMSVSTKILGTATVTGVSGSNYVLADSNVGGSLNVNLGPGNNTLDLNLNVAPGVAGRPGGPMVVGKDVNFTAGDGNNTLIIEDNGNTPPNPLNVNGNFNVNFGNGNNTYTFFNTAADFNVAGNLFIRAGNGTNVIPFIGTVSGSESYYLGNGIGNAVTISTPPGGNLNFTGGNGGDSLTLRTPAAPGTSAFYNLNAHFGNGDDTLTLGGGGGAGSTIAVSGFADGGGRLVANTFIQDPSCTLIPPFTLINFP